MIEFNTVANFSDSTLWNLAYEEIRIEEQTFPRRFPAIDPWVVPITFDSHVFAVSASTALYKDSWYTAGYLSQTLEFSGVGFTLASGATFRVPLNRTVLLIYPKLTDEFQLRFSPCGWIIDITLRIWNFNGPIITREEELLDVIRVDLARIEAKIDNP